MSTRKKTERISLATNDALEQVPDYLSVRDAATILGASERSVYGYIEDGKLPGASMRNLIVVRREDVERLERRAPGRLRVNTPRWRIPPARNSQFLTTITVHVRSGQVAALADRLAEMRRYNRHNFPGTVARSIVRNQCNPDEIEIQLFWRGASMPSAEEKEAALTVLATDLVDVLDWETVRVKEGQVLLHAQ